MLKRFRAATAANANSKGTEVQVHPVQRVPAEISSEHGVARLKVDLALLHGDKVIIAGWRTGLFDVRFEGGGGAVGVEWLSFQRPDVAEHFGLPRHERLGFVVQVKASEQPLRLTWSHPVTGTSFLADLQVAPSSGVSEGDLHMLGPLAVLLKGSSSKAAQVDPQLRQLADSGLFDATWYKSAYEDVARAQVDPLVHFHYRGCAEGRAPNYLFDVAWYLDRYPDVRTARISPVQHYVDCGEREGRQPGPCFDPDYYRFQLDRDQLEGLRSLLGHYLGGGWRQRSPNEFFDCAYYLERHSDVREADSDPLLHYLQQGWREGREIHRRFSFKRYGAALQARLGRDVEPLSYYLSVGRRRGESLPTQDGGQYLTEGASGLAEQLTASQQPGPHFERECIGTIELARQAQARVFAFYLPQFHPVPENDAWWGKGFTEWTNVTRAQPRFAGHHQPRLPRDLGYYDLRSIEPIRQQVDLAKRSGVAGFCFYYYWFNGKRLLEKPLDLFVAHADIEFPFCLIWANENWTRRWDGMEQDVLMSQEYLAEDDEALMADFVRYFADPRYERIDGRPLMFVYRPGLIPETRARIERWRDLLRSRHDEDPLILMAQGFGDSDPRSYGLDGAIEFPPHKLAADLKPLNAQLEVFDPSFSGHYLAYDDLVKRSREVEAPGFALIRTAVPSWDNEARKPGRGMGFVGAEPGKYEDWLRYLVAWSGRHPVFGKQRYVFINAWNEWAEGAYLEPDVHNGAAYLNATLRATCGLARSSKPSKRVLLVGHDAYLHGAQLLMLNIMRTMRRQFGVEVVLLLLEGGPLVEEYRKMGKVVVASESGLPIDVLLDSVVKDIPSSVAVCNTVVTGQVAWHLANRGFTVVSLVHELPRLISERGLELSARALAQGAHRIVFAADFVRQRFEDLVGPLDDKARIMPQGIYQTIRAEGGEHDWLREHLGIGRQARVVLNLGFGDLRKGFDLFVDAARQLCRADPDVHFLWLGNLQPDLKTWLAVDIESPELCDRFHVLPFDSAVAPYLLGADLMLLTSREDPYPSTVLEALAGGLPVVAFARGGGYEEAIRRHEGNGSLVPMGDTRSMAAAAAQWLAHDGDKGREERKARATATYDWPDYVFGLLQQAWPELQKVSVVIPNYNYERYLPSRLSSVFSQDYPVYEVIVLDDASPDRSVDVIHACLEAEGRDAIVVPNEENSGSVFRQWSLGTRLARGDLLWIAEADDDSTPQFLAAAVSAFTDNAVMAFTDSAQIDGEGNPLGSSYGFYSADLPNNLMTSSGAWPGDEFARHMLSVKNTILNVSAVVFRREAMTAALDLLGNDLSNYRMAGDWRLYVELLLVPNAHIAYVDTPANIHRRHASSVTHTQLAASHVAEIVMVQELVGDRCDLSCTQLQAMFNYRAEITAQLLGEAESADVP